MYTLVFRELAEDLVKKESEIPHTAWLRSVYASISSPFFHRPYVVTNYATDLGVRVRLDPKIYLQEVTKRVGLNLSDYAEQFSTLEHLENWMVSGRDEIRLRMDMDVLVNYAGEWEAAAHLAKSFIETWGLPTDYLLATYFAAALGSQQADPLADRIYSDLEDSAKTPADQAMTRIRYAAYKIKRCHDYEAAIAILDRNDSALALHRCCRELSDGDTDTLLGVSHNLRALVEIKRSQVEEAKKLIDRARSELCTCEMLVTVGEDEKKRYCEQATINWIQLMVFDDKMKEALFEADKYADWVQRNHYDYVGEAYHILGYLFYLAGDYEKARIYLSQSIEKLSNDGNITAAQSAKKILAVSLSKLGDKRLSGLVVSSIHHDPAGLDFTRMMSEGEQ
ncbi:hypothetical protein [uncultured Bifidobacterium sp.]|uniref:hypothetical protein n=1 Tax=uncultured Bifidobacterium sp. TaxID=165187 RepID=UPI002593CB44|nr:hypothetical protein [uncultured Bifidobacterium sp.]